MTFITLYSSRDSQNWFKVGDFKSQDEIKEYEDTSVEVNDCIITRLNLITMEEVTAIAVIDMSTTNHFNLH